MMKLKQKMRLMWRGKGFTLIETLIAITLLLMAVVEPMALTAQSLKTAYYARDQITASNLAQEAIEAVRSVRDGQILISALPPGNPVDIFGPIPIDKDFTVDTTKASNDPAMMTVCTGTCPPLQTNGTLYAYSAGWANTGFTRVVRASYVPGTTDEMLLKVTVTWRTSSYPARTIIIYENLYRWVSN